MRGMQIHFLGGATTVTGSQFLVTTERAKVLIDCGMFQGSPNESVRNRIPFAFDPAEVDAVVLTHAHLDHCGLLPLLVKSGYDGAIHATAGTTELATLVLLDSGHLHEEFAKREARWEKRHPDLVAADDRAEAEAYQAAVDLAAAGSSEAAVAETANAPEAAVETAAAIAESMTAPASAASEPGEHVETTIEPEPPHVWPTDPEADLRAQPPAIDIDLDQPLYTVKDAERAVAHLRPIEYDEEREVAPGVWATFLDAGHILGSAIIRLRIQERDGGEERLIVCSGDLGRPGTPIIRDPTYLTAADYVLVESTYGGREHEPQDEAIRVLAETVRIVADAGGVLLVPSFAIGRTQEVIWRDPAPAAISRLADGVQGVRYLSAPQRLLRRRDRAASSRGRDAARLSGPDRHQRRQGIAGHPTGAASVHDRGLERDADRRSGRRPPAQPDRRSECHDPFRRLPGRGDAGRAPPGWCPDRPPGRPAARSPLQRPLDQWLLRPRR
jgi:Cft2 family RNA processing exonuclease